MLYIKLASPVILHSKLQEIADKLGEPRLSIQKVLLQSLLLNENGNGTFEYLTEKEFNERMEDGTLQEYPVDRRGVDAILYMARKKGVEIPFISEIKIPSYVWERSSAWDWEGFAYMCYRIENRQDRLVRLRELGAPDVIVRNEIRMYYEAVWALDDNRYGEGFKRSDSKRYTSLLDIGFLLQEEDWTLEEKERQKLEFEEWEAMEDIDEK